jgi:uncharacterized protein (TIGR02757 family)
VRSWLETVYNRYNHRSWVHTDPLGYVCQYRDPADREIVGLLASCLAFGRVAQIRASLDRLLQRTGRPSVLLENTDRPELGRLLAGFRHRYVTGADVADLLEGVRRLVVRWGSLNRYFVTQCYDPAVRTGRDMVTALSRFSASIAEARGRPSYLMPDPRLGSACKRLHLFLRWMVRRDRVDPGVWCGVRPCDLIVPMDTHMHRICRLLGLVERRQPDLAAAREATAAFRLICPEDPVRYDFGLTRMGMAGDLEEILRARPQGGRLVRGRTVVVR